MGSEGCLFMRSVLSLSGVVSMCRLESLIPLGLSSGGGESRQLHFYHNYC